MHPLDVQTSGPQAAALCVVKMQLAHAPASTALCCHAWQVVGVAVDVMHAATNAAISVGVHAPICFAGIAIVAGAKPDTSQLSQASGQLCSLHEPRCATGFGAPPHTVVSVPSHAHAGAPLHCPLDDAMQLRVAEQPPLGGYKHFAPT